MICGSIEYELDPRCACNFVKTGLLSSSFKVVLVIKGGFWI